jgi:cell division protease FtsH
MIALLLAATLLVGGPPAPDDHQADPSRTEPQPAQTTSTAVSVESGQGQARRPETRTVSLSELLGEIKRGAAASARVDDRRRRVSVTLRDGGGRSAAYPPGFAPDLTARLLAAGVDVTAVEPARGPLSPTIAFIVLFSLIMGLILVVARRRGAGQGRQAASPAQFSKGRGEQVTVPDTRFSDVAGADEAVEDLRELVRFLRAPERFASAGARLPNGYLLVGPPGTGKTLLARAVAGEAEVPFYAMSGSEFVETYVGVGASRMRTLFERARGSRRAIVFIDEIDAIGKTRSAGPSHGGNDERETTLNQLLVEMDGFAQASTVVIAATNRPEMLDPALLRPGRFDRQIVVPPPERRGRRGILELYGRDRPLAGDVDLDLLARRTAGFTGADLANLINQAALAAVRGDAAEITQAHVDEALATVMLGPARRSIEVAERDRVITAWHEAGHALAGLLVPEADDPVQVSIVPRGAAGGATWFAASDELFLTARQARARLLVALAGRVGEELYLGDDFTQGAADDFRAATGIARRMVTEFGMSTLGPRHISPEEVQFGPLAGDVHAATHQLMDEAIEAARELLGAHRDTMAAVVGALLAEETVDLTDLRRLAGIPPAPAG